MPDLQLIPDVTDLVRLVDMGIISRHEARKMLGLPDDRPQTSISRPGTDVPTVKLEDA